MIIIIFWFTYTYHTSIPFQEGVEEGDIYNIIILCILLFAAYMCVCVYMVWKRANDDVLINLFADSTLFLFVTFFLLMSEKLIDFFLY